LQHRFGLGFGFYFSKNPVFGWVLGFFKKKKWKFSGKTVIKEEKNHSFLQTYCKALGCNGGKNLGCTKNQPKYLMVNPYITKSFGY
jgi:hypothetical protein